VLGISCGYWYTSVDRELFYSPRPGLYFESPFRVGISKMKICGIENTAIKN
jgi:hypothetical protein